MRTFIAALTFLLGALVVLVGQTPGDPKLRRQLEQLFPDAASFSPKGGSPPHFKAYGPAGAGKDAPLLGLAYWTTELEPLERGYDGPIKMLVGLDTRGILRGIIVTEHHEPYGDFSVDPPRFAAQFKNKDIRDPFRVGMDIDAISRATISVTSASRAVRNSSRCSAVEATAPGADTSSIA